MNIGLSGALPRAGEVALADQVVRLIRLVVTEEYSVSVDGVRQEFIVAERPEGTGQLRVELAEQVSVPTIDTFGCARFHPFGNGKPQKRAGPATRERRKPWRRQAPPVYKDEG